MRYIFHLCNVGLYVRIWVFDEMGLGEQVILSYKGNRGIEQIVNHEKCLVI